MLILAGGEATRLPGKLIEPLAAVPMLVRVYRMLSDEKREIVISCKGTFARAIDDALQATLVVDRLPARGPLGGMLTAMATMRSRHVFVAAGDAPLVDAAFVARLESEYRSGDEAAVPVRSIAGSEQREPLAALYDRFAFIREGLPLIRAGRGSVQAVIARLRTGFVPIEDEGTFANINTPHDLARFRATLESE